MKKLDRFLLGTLLLGAVLLTLDYSRPSPLRDALASSQESAAELGAAFQRFKNRGASEVPSVAGVALETAQPQTEARREVSQQLIPEVLSLKKGQLLPRSLFDKYGINAIAESLVRRLSSMAAKTPKISAAEETVNMRTETELHIWADSNNFIKFVREGIKNQFQTGTSNGIYELGARNRVEEQLIGVKFVDGGVDAKYGEKQVNELRPKYGTLFFPGLKTDIHKHFFSYGDFILVMSDQLKDRSTWTSGDSLTMSGDQRIDLGGSFWEQAPKSWINKEYAWDGGFFEFQTFGEIRIEDVAAIGIVSHPSMRSLYMVRKNPNIFRDTVIEAGFRVIEFEHYDVSRWVASHREEEVPEREAVRFKHWDYYRKKRVLSEGDPSKLARWIQKVRAGEIAEPVSDEKAR